jgi:RNA polymerase sigma factor (sigma-70 family)
MLQMRTSDDIHDEWLVIRCQDGDDDALAELVDRWQPRLRRHAMRLMGAAGEVDEIVQVTWVAIVRGVRRLNDPACFRRWAYQIITHKCADWIRAQQRERAKMRSLVEEPVDENASGDMPEDEITLLRDVLKQLPTEQRAVLSMFYLESMSLTEIAEVFSLPVGTVKSRMHYARIKLKAALQRRKP